MHNASREALRLQRDVTKTWGQIVPARLRALRQYAAAPLLDIGCSRGLYVEALRSTELSVFGCDVLPDQAWFQVPQRPFCAGDLMALPFCDGAFNSCSAFEVLEHLDDVDAALQEMRRITRQNIIVSVPNCLQPPEFKESGLAFHHWTDRTHRQAFTSETLQATLQRNGFKTLHVEFINAVIPELLALTGWRVPPALARMLGQVCKRLPLRRPYGMTILAVASRS